MAAGLPALGVLLKKATIEDHEEIIKACNATLKQSKGNLEAQYTKVIALLKLDRYDDALHMFEESGQGLKSKARLEHAYTLYKSGDLEQALIEARQIKDSRAALHLEAQISYRSENFVHAARIYQKLSGDIPQAFQREENDLRINGGATNAQLEWQRQGHLVQRRKVDRVDLEAFETAYNAACGCIARGELGQAEVMLQRARNLCASSDELSDAEKTAELLPISVQQLYVLTMLGEIKKAEDLAAGLTVDQVPDLSTRQVAQFNKLSAETNKSNPYLAHRIIHSMTPIPKSDRLFNYQQNLISQSEIALDLIASKFTGVINTTTRHISNHEKQSTPTTESYINAMSVANAAAHAQNQLGKIGLKSVLPLLEKRPHDVGLILVIIHLYMLTKNPGSAITVLETFFKRLDESKSAASQEVRFAPGLVATMVSLYSNQGRKCHIRTELAKAASYWRHKSKHPSSLLVAAGISLLDSSNPEDLSVAGDIFESLHKEEPKDKLRIAGYVAANAFRDLPQVRHAVEQLTPVNRLIAGIDVAALESAGVPQPRSAVVHSLTKKRPAEGDSKPAKKRVRKSRLPKDYDPSKPADPERWLPLRDRSTYRPKGKKGKQKQAAQTQGGVTEKVAEGLNISSSDATSTKPANTVISAPSKQSKKKKPKK